MQLAVGVNQELALIVAGIGKVKRPFPNRRIGLVKRGELKTTSWWNWPTPRRAR